MTDFAREVLLIAQRVVGERADGREVDPARLRWAHDVIRAHASGDPYPTQIIREAGTWELQSDRAALRRAGPFDGLAA